MKRLIRSFFLALMLVVTVIFVPSVVSASPGTLYVDDDYTDSTPGWGVDHFDTIQAAVNAASDDDTILVAAGTYDEQIVIDKSLTLVSVEGKDNTIINGRSTGYTGAVVVTSGTSDVTIGDTGKGFTVNGAGQAAIYVVGSNDSITICSNKLVAANTKNALLTGGVQSNHIIADNEFSGTASQLVYVNGEASLGSANASIGVNFTNNTFSGTATGPALGQEATNSTVSGNTFATVTGYAALELWGGGNTVTDNNFTADLPANGLYVLDNTGTLGIAAALIDNTFLRAVVVEHPGSSLLPKIWANIQPAIDAAEAGDTVEVYPGTYTENVDVDKRVTIQSQNGTSETTVDGSTGHAFNVTVDDVSISGFTVKGATAGEKAGIYLDQGEECNFSANICLDNYYGICLDNSSNNTLIGNTANSNTKHGIYLDGSDENTVSGNTTSQNGECGIYVDNSNNNTLTENTVSGNGAYGINLDASSNNTLTANCVTENDIGVEIQGSVDTPTVSINFNNIVGNTDYGVDNDGTNTIDATNNWWGDASGPSDQGPGTGDAVSTNVDYEPWIGAGVEEAKSQDVSGTGGTISADDSSTGGEITVSGSDIPEGTTVTTAKYEDNPGGTPIFEATGDYYDVYLDDDTGVDRLTVEFSPADKDTVIYYWDETSWRRASNQSYSDGYTVVTITDSTSPSLSDLSELPFGSGTPPPVGGIVYSANKLALVAPWIALGLVIIAGAIIFVRRRRAWS